MEKYRCRWCKYDAVSGQVIDELRAEKLLILHVMNNHGFTKAVAKRMVAAWLINTDSRGNE